jgi:hypothetical protein
MTGNGDGSIRLWRLPAFRRVQLIGEQRRFETE